MMTRAHQQAILINRLSYSSFQFQKAVEDDSAMFFSRQRSTLTVFYNIILQRHRVPLHSHKLLFRIARFKRTTITNDFNGHILHMKTSYMLSTQNHRRNLKFSVVMILTSISDIRHASVAVESFMNYLQQMLS